MKKMACDLHIHSSASDGTLSPEHIVDESRKLGLSYIAITDHDSVKSVDRALSRASTAKFPKVIPGVELSAEMPQGDLHLLGYFIDHNDKRLLNILERNARARIKRAKKIVERLNESGVGISFRSVLEISEGGTVGRSHIARVLIADGLASSVREVFSKFLGRGTSFYVEKKRISLEEAVDIITMAGGVPILAHPGTIKWKIDFEDIKGIGIKGLEAIHSNHSIGDTVKYMRKAEELGLLITGGSDSHGPRSLFDRKLGAVKVSNRYAELLVEFHERTYGSV